MTDQELKGHRGAGREGAPGALAVSSTPGTLARHTPATQATLHLHPLASHVQGDQFHRH